MKIWESVGLNWKQISRWGVEQAGRNWILKLWRKMWANSRDTEVINREWPMKRKRLYVVTQWVNRKERTKDKEMHQNSVDVLGKHPMDK